MSEQHTDLVPMYLPLLSHAEQDVRRQAGIILLSTYGERAFTFLRRLLEDPDPHVREQARTGLQVATDISGHHVQIQPFRGIYIECLGHFQVYLGSQCDQPYDWMQHNAGRAGWRKVQGVAAYLVHVGLRGASRKELGMAVWGGPVSPVSLSRTLTSLRQALAAVGAPELVERALIITRDHCTLLPGFYETDVQLFERTFGLASHTEESNGLAVAVPLYEQAIRLYGGPYMENVACASPWSQEQRHLLLLHMVIAAERLAEHDYTLGRYQGCMIHCRKALAADPSAEEATVLLLRACSRLGLRTELDHAYRQYLRASATDHDDQNDSVVQAYRELRSGRPGRL